MLGRRQKMRFADQWSLKHIYNGQSALALATACNQMRQLQGDRRGGSVRGGDMQNGQRQAIKSMPKLIYLRELHKIDKLQMHLELTARGKGQRGRRGNSEEKKG